MRVKGGNGIKICMCKHTVSGGLGACPPGNFCILDSFRLLLVHSRVATTSVERSFSQMKLIKTRLRSNLNDKSLSNLMKIALESPVELTDSHLEEIVDVWNRKSRRIVV